MPSDADIEKVKQNLANLQAFNDYQYNHGNPLIANCYALLSQQDNSDKGLAVVVNMMCSSFWAMAAIEAGPAGAVGANTLCGILSAWANGSPPPDMGGTFSSLLDRFQHASLDVDAQLATYHADPVTYWDTTFTYMGQTCTLGDLATIDFPAEDDPEFFVLMNPCLFALDQYIWRFVLTSGGFQLNEWLPETTMPPGFDFDAWGNSFYVIHPAYWATCEWHQDTGECGDESCYYLTQWNLATGHGAFSDGSIAEGAADYLFSDLSSGTPNPKTSWDGQGLYTREEVFTTWGMKVVQVWGTYAPSPKHRAAYLRAKRDGKPVLSDLLAEIGMGGIKTRILDAVRGDPSLRVDLQRFPHDTMERILGVVVPRFVDFTFVVEGPRHHALVLPWDAP